VILPGGQWLGDGHNSTARFAKHPREGKLTRTTPARATACARVADLAGAERIETAHLAEAVQYRPRWQM